MLQNGGYANDQWAHERWPTSLVTRKIHRKTTMRFHYKTNKMAKIRKNDNSKWCWGCGTIGALGHWFLEYKILS
jgi:hypothetical protein